MPLGAARLTLLAFQASTAAAAEVIRKKRGISGNGSIAIDTAQSYFGGSSVLSGGSTDTLLFEGSVIPTASDATFTIESWVRFTGTNSRKMLYSQYTTGVGRTSMEIGTDEKASFFCARQSSFQEADRILSNSALSVNTWYHIAVVRESTTFTMYIDGVAQTDTITGHSAGVQDQDFEIFGDDFGTHSDDVHQDEFRISDTARYTSGFTVPTAPFINDDNTLLLCHFDGTDGSTFFDDDNGVDRSAVGVSAIGNAQVDTAESQFGVGSLELDGTGDYLLIDSTYNSNFSFTGDFTIELWANADTLGTNLLVNNWSPGLWFGYFNSTSFRVYLNNTLVVNGGDPGIGTGTWAHYAVTRSGTDVKIFINGTQLGSTGTGSGTITLSDSTAIGANFDNGSPKQFWDGYIDEVRFSDTARYTANFTAPTAPFVNDNNTLLLLHMDGTNGNTLFLDDNGSTRAKVGVESINGAAIDTASYQWAGASAEFDDTNDYLELPFSVGNFSGDFTVECWIDTADTEGEFMACQKQGTAEGWTLITRSLNRLIWTSTTDGSTASALVSSNSAWSDNTWTHVAVCHNNSSGLTELFANGTRVGSRTEQNPKTVTSGGYFRIGGNIYGVSSGTYSDGPRYYGGHLDDVRISDSVRYSGSTYTVPTGPFQNDSNTLLLLPMNGTDGDTHFVDDNGKEKN